MCRLWAPLFLVEEREVADTVAPTDPIVALGGGLSTPFAAMAVLERSAKPIERGE